MWVRGRANYHLIGIEISGVEEARYAARRQLRAGPDWLKVMATAGIGGGTGKLIGEPGWQELTQEIGAITVEAHNVGRKVAVHAIGASGIKAALRAGADSIEHGHLADDEAIAMMAERRVPLVPTLEVLANFAAHGLEQGWDSNIVENSRRGLEVALENVRRAYEAGVMIGTGSDMELAESPEKWRCSFGRGYPQVPH
jgi:imidazolonepropionase-like amidohydrolase